MVSRQLRRCWALAPSPAIAVRCACVPYPLFTAHPVAGQLGVVVNHEGVALDLGQHARGGDGKACRSALIFSRTATSTPSSSRSGAPAIRALEAVQALEEGGLFAPAEPVPGCPSRSTTSGRAAAAATRHVRPAAAPAPGRAHRSPRPRRARRPTPPPTRGLAAPGPDERRGAGVCCRARPGSGSARSGSTTTSPTVTGPASAPRPTSSHPPTRRKPCAARARSVSNVGSWADGSASLPGRGLRGDFPRAVAFGAGALDPGALDAGSLRGLWPRWPPRPTSSLPGARRQKRRGGPKRRCRSGPAARRSRWFCPRHPRCQRTRRRCPRGTGSRRRRRGGHP